MSSPVNPYGQHPSQYPGQPQYGQPQYGQPYGMQPYPQYGTPPAYGHIPQGPVRPSVGFVQSLVLAFKNAFVFYGRASLSEYWWTYLWQVIVGIVMLLLLVAMGLSGAVAFYDYSQGGLGWGVVQWVLAAATVAVGLAGVALGVAGISLTVRRLHDANQSGWFILCGFLNALVPLVGTVVLLVLTLKASDPMGARFDDPSGAQPAV